jgi:hypothetical protein
VGTPYRTDCTIAGRPGVVRVNVDLQDVPDPARPLLLYVALDLRNPDDSGLPAGEERDELDDLEEALEQVLSAELDAQFVGTISTAGRHEIYFYAPTTDRFGVVADPLLSEFDEYGFDLGTHEDPAWSHYRGVLLGRTAKTP